MWGELDAAEGVPAASRHLDHPSREEPRARPPLRGGAPQPEAPRAARAVAHHLEDAAQGAPQGEGQALERLPHLGLHGGERQVAHRAAAEDPRRRVRAARRPQPEGRGDPGQGAGLLGHERPELHARRRTRDRAHDLRHVHRAVLPRPPRAARRARATTTRARSGTRCPPRSPATSPRRRSSATSRAPRSPPPRASRSTATACSARTRRSRRINIKNMSAEHDFTFCATDWAGMSALDIPNAIEILQDISKFPSLADRLQQGIVNTLYLGRLLAHPQGFAANAALPGRRRPEAARHVEPLLRLQLAGRDPRRPGHRGRARLEARGAGRGDDELRRAAAALGGLRHLQRHLQARLSRRRHAPVPRLADPDALGSRRDERLGPPRDQAGRRATPRSTRCCCTWRWATTRWPTSCPTSRRARSARPPTARPWPPGRSTDKTPLFGIPSIGSFPFARLGDRLLGRRPADAARAGAQHPEPRRARPARLPAQHRGGAQPEVGVPVAERRR